MVGAGRQGHHAPSSALGVEPRGATMSAPLKRSHDRAAHSRRSASTTTAPPDRPPKSTPLQIPATRATSDAERTLVWLCSSLVETLAGRKREGRMRVRGGG